MKKNLGMNKLRNILEAIVLEKEKNSWFHIGLKLLRNVVKLLHKGLEIFRSMILNLRVAFLMAFCVAFTFFCFDPSVKPREEIKNIFLQEKGEKHAF